MPPKVPAPHLVIPDFLSAEKHGSLLDWALQQQDHFTPSGIGYKRSVQNDVRRSLILTQNLGPTKEIFRSVVKQRYQAWMEQLRASTFHLAGVELEIAAHNDGAHFSAHIDTLVHAPVASEMRRMLSAVYYFHAQPKAFTGGTLRMFPLGGKSDSDVFTDIQPTDNTLVVFPSWALHQVLPVQCPSGRFQDSRFAVNCWLLEKVPAKTNAN